MDSYRKLWVAVGVPVLVAASVVAVLQAPGATGVLFGFGGFIGTVAVLGHSRPDQPGPRGWAACRSFTRPALLGGLALTGALGLGMIDSQLMLGVLILAALTSPPVVGLAAGAATPANDVPLAEVIDIDSAASLTGQSYVGYARLVMALEIELSRSDLSSMTDQEVCRAWRRSFVLLDAASSPSSRLKIVQLRAAYLDELERRQPRALQAWLDAGGRAASGPDKYFSDAS